MILNVITAIRESFSGAVKVYTGGGCHRFFLILKAIYPQAEEYFDSDHVITEIDGKFYDITGEVTPKTHITVRDNYKPS